MLSIPTFKIIYNNLYYSAPACYILKTKIIINKIYTKRFSTITKIYSCSWFNIKKNCPTSKP